MTIPFKAPDRDILLVGGLGRCELSRFGGTQYAKVVLNELWGMPPELDLDYETRVQAAVREIVRAQPAVRNDRPRTDIANNVTNL